VHSNYNSGKQKLKFIFHKY